ncbi:hypothetical protein G7054_g8125 [Neopestalotiopsis clavispora]|nr:hypothetical protein G7054_g8125 [Neopestalotiopsis clavispora]
MALLSFILGLALTTSVTACPGHTNHQVKAKRADFTVPESNVTVPSPAEWAYDESYDWGMLSPDRHTTIPNLPEHGNPRPVQQASPNLQLRRQHHGHPAQLGLRPGLYARRAPGRRLLVQPGHDVRQRDSLPRGLAHSRPRRPHRRRRPLARRAALRPRGAEGHEKAVVGFRIDPAPTKKSSLASSSAAGSASLNVDISDLVQDAFFAQLPETFHRWDDTESEESMALDLGDALEAVARLDTFFTYEGSLTSPPCHEGIRWFIAARVLEVSIPQMQAILAASTYSARFEQMIWEHHINE